MMAKITVDVIRNADGSITAKYGNLRASFMEEPWYTEDEIVDRVRWELVSLGASFSKDTVIEVTYDAA